MRIFCVPDRIRFGLIAQIDGFLFTIINCSLEVSVSNFNRCEYCIILVLLVTPGPKQNTQH
jgi:hypothetical protein